MQGVITKYFNYVGASEEITRFFINAFIKLTSTPENEKELLDILSVYEKDYNCSFSNLDKKMDALCEKVGISPYAGNALKYILMIPSFKRHSDALGYPHSVLSDTVKDVYYHVINCKLVKGVYGSFTNWHSYLWSFKVFGVGRLQVWPMTADFDYESESLKIKKGQTILDLHIPRTETPLDRQSVDKSLALCVQLFKDKLAGAPIVFRCSSWLLFNKNFSILKPGSNILDFISRFTILENKTYDDYSELWRLFDAEYKGEIADLKADSSLRRAYIKMIENGEKIGYGTGYFNY